MPLNIEIEVQDCETLTLEIIDAPVSPSGSIDDDAGLGDTYVTWSADKSTRELADKVDKVAGMGLSELSFTTADKNSLDQSEQDRHTHANKSVIDDLSDNAGALEYRGLPVSDQAALDSKVDKVLGYSLVADDEIDKLSTVEQDAQKNTVISVAGKQGDVLLDKSDVGLSEVDNTADADKPVSTAVADALDDIDALVVENAEAIGDLSQLPTLAKSNLVEVIVEVVDSNMQNLLYVIDLIPPIDDAAGLGDTNVTWSADKSSRELADKVDKQAGKGLSDTNFTQAEKDKLIGIASEATKNRADSENADKIHTHAISDVTGLSTRLNDIDALIGDVESVLVAINGEP